MVHPAEIWPIAPLAKVNFKVHDLLPSYFNVTPLSFNLEVYLLLPDKAKKESYVRIGALSPE